MNTQPKYTVEQAVLHLQNGGAIENDNRELVGMLKYVIMRASKEGCNIPLGSSVYYWLDSKGVWCDGIQTTRPTIKLSEIGEMQPYEKIAESVKDSISSDEIKSAWKEMWKSGEVDDKFTKNLTAAYFFAKGYRAHSTPSDKWIEQEATIKELTEALEHMKSRIELRDNIIEALSRQNKD